LIMFSIHDEKNWKVWPDKEGLLFSFKKSNPLDFSSTPSKEQSTNERAALLRILEEQNGGKPINNGIKFDWDVVCSIPSNARQSLRLPNPWYGSFSLTVHGRSVDPDFNIRIKLLRPNEQHEEGVDIKGGLFKIGHQCYLADALQYKALCVLEDFQHKRKNGLTQYQSLSALKELQDLAQKGLDIDLNAFNELEIIRPDAVRVSLSQEKDGSVSITPDLCEKQNTSVGARSVVAPETLDTRIENYVGEDQQSGCMPVGRKLILLDEKTVSGIREILSNRNIPAERVASFLKEPTAWLNAEYVDLDLGFSKRVQGAAPLRLAYFGETDQSGIQWVEPKEAQLEEKTENTPKTENDADIEDGIDYLDEDDLQDEPVILDIELADEGESQQVSIQAPSEELISDGGINQAGLRRIPYPHQEHAIRWLMALSMEQNRDKRWRGALLADDMGLGKTLTALVFIREYLLSCDTKRPALIVAPVSLLRVWKKEIELSFDDNPFSEVIILHSSEDLNRYKIAGAKREIHAAEPEANAGSTMEKDLLEGGIRYALRVSDDHGIAGPDCLGKSRSIVITNYETVRDYQFSLARIPWSVAVFDEAQYIKNPNAMVTRAAKALNTTFNIVMTGTPVENSLKDFWCLMDSAQPGYLNNYQPFRKKYITPIIAARRDSSPEVISKVRNNIGAELRSRVGGFMLRRMKEDHLTGLPEKKIILHNRSGDPISGYDDRIVCDMPKAQQDIYDQIANLPTESGENNDSASSGKGQIILAAIHNLKVASLHPDLVVSGKLPIPRNKKEARETINKSGKLIKLIEILNIVRSKDEKVLIFIMSKALQAYLQSAIKAIYDLPEMPRIINGDTKVSKSRSSATNRSRTEIIDIFQSNPGFGVLILSPVAAGVGLTITEANHVIHLERHWNPAKEAQATDRVYRIGQKLPVSVWVPILKHPTHQSFDEKLDQLLAMKSGLSQSVVTPDIVNPSELESLISHAKAPEKSRIYPKDVYKLKWDLFEALVAILIEMDGAEKVILTQGQGDKGCDVVALGWKGENWLVQCKHKQDIKGQVGGKCVREIVGSRKYYESKLDRKLNGLCVFSNVKKFDKSAKEEASLQHSKLFGLGHIKRLFPSNGISLSNLLIRKEQTEKI
jgi:SNF2 family DNA or RNA helicase